jgi:hypothetical protein
MATCTGVDGGKADGERRPLINSPDRESRNRALTILENKVAKLLDVVFFLENL